MPEPSNPAAVLFDKDGTLLDLHLTWGLALGTAIAASAHSPADELQAYALMQYDVDEQRMAATSPFVAEPVDVINNLLRPHLDLAHFDTTLGSTAANKAQPASGAGRLLDALQTASVPCIIVTNDGERGARRQIEALGWSHYFTEIIGADSGYGAKPDPTVVEHACSIAGTAPAATWMIGDSIHDVLAGKRAGCRTALITNGESPTQGAVDHADIIIETLDQLDLNMLQLS